MAPRSRPLFRGIILCACAYMRLYMVYQTFFQFQGVKHIEKYNIGTSISGFQKFYPDIDVPMLSFSTFIFKGEVDGFLRKLGEPLGFVLSLGESRQTGGPWERENCKPNSKNIRKFKSKLGKANNVFLKFNDICVSSFSSVSTKLLKISSQGARTH